MEKGIQEILSFLDEAHLAISRNCEVVSKDEVPPEEPEPLPSSQLWERWEAL